MPPARVPGILVLYSFIPPYASTVLEHASALSHHSRFPVSMVNTHLGFPRAIRNLRFDAVVLHYSLFGTLPYALSERFLEYLEASRDAYKIGFFQDEYRFCRERFEFIDRYGLDCVFTLVEPRYWEATYRRHTSVPKLVYTLPGYVSEAVRDAARLYARPDSDRTVDVAYRARDVPFALGAAGREKTFIGREFAGRPHGLRVDIDVDGANRLYGREWWKFLGDARGVLGVEGGSSVFDLTGDVTALERALRQRRPYATYAEFEAEAAPLLAAVDCRIPHVMITPRHFEAAVFGCCQILFEGRYSDVLDAGEHYIPLRKDFSNFDDVIAEFRDRRRRAEISAAARRDLVDSGHFDYMRLAAGVDSVLAEAGVEVAEPSDVARRALGILRREQAARVAAGATVAAAARANRLIRDAAVRAPVRRLRNALNS